MGDEFLWDPAGVKKMEHRKKQIEEIDPEKMGAPNEPEEPRQESPEAAAKKAARQQAQQGAPPQEQPKVPKPGATAVGGETASQRWASQAYKEPAAPSKPVGAPTLRGEKLELPSVPESPHPAAKTKRREPAPKKASAPDRAEVQRIKEVLGRVGVSVTRRQRISSDYVKFDLEGPPLDQENRMPLPLMVDYLSDYVPGAEITHQRNDVRYSEEERRQQASEEAARREDWERRAPGFPYIPFPHKEYPWSMVIRVPIAEPKRPVITAERGESGAAPRELLDKIAEIRNQGKLGDYLPPPMPETHRRNEINASHYKLVYNSRVYAPGQEVQPRRRAPRGRRGPFYYVGGFYVPGYTSGTSGHVLMDGSGNVFPYKGALDPATSPEVELGPVNYE